MATYRIQGPDGKNYAFDAPPGLSSQQLDIIRDGLFQPEEPAPAPVAPPQPKAETGIIPSLIRGGRGIYSLLGDVAPAMLGKLVGAEDYAKRQMQEAAEYQAETQRRYPAEVPSFTDIKDVGTALTYVKEAIAEAIPSIIPSIFTGGAAAIASRGAVAAAERAAATAATEFATKELVRKGGQAALTAEAVEATKQAAIKAGQDAAKRVAVQYEVGGALAGSAAQNIPEVYQNLYEKAETGGLPDLAPAIVAGSFNAVLDAITPINILRKAKLSGIPDEQIIGEWYKRAVKGGVKGFFTEAGTETLQEMSSAAAESFVNQNAKFFTPENFVRFIDAALKGGFGGAAITGAADVAFGRAPEAPTGGEPGAADALATKILAEGEPSAAVPEQPQPTTGGGGFEISEQPTEPAPTAGVAGTQQPGVVPVEPDVAATVGGEGQPTPPVAEAPAPTTTPTLPAPTPAPAPAAEALAEGPFPIPEGFKPFSEWMEERKKANPPVEPEPYVAPTEAEKAERRKKIKTEIRRDEALIGKEYDKERASFRFGDEATQSLYEATAKGELPADQPLGSRRFSDTLFNNSIDPALYELPEDFNNFSASQRQEYREGIAKDVHAQLDKLLGKRAELPDWTTLPRDGKDVFLANMTENTPEERARARMHLRSYLDRVAKVQGTTRTKTKATPEARIYETNRAAYNKFEQVDFPTWDKLTDEQRELFTTSLRKYSPKQKSERGSSVQQDFAFKALGNKLKEERDVREAEKKKKAVPPSYERAQKEIEEKQKAPEEKPRAESTVETAFGREATTEEIEKGEKATQEAREKRAATSEKLREAINQNDIKRVLNLINANSKNPIQRLVAQRILQLTAGMKTKISLVDKLPNNHVAEYDPKTDEIRVTEDGVKYTTLLHEVVHAATVRTIYRYYSGQKLTQEERDAVEQLIDVMEVAKKEIGDKHPRAFADLYEFVSYGMSDRGFQRDLAAVKSKNLEYSELPQKFSLWTDFLKAVSEFFPTIKRMFDKKGKLKEDEANLLAETFNAFEQIVSVPEGGVEMAPFPETFVAGKAPSELSEKEFIDKVLAGVQLKESGGRAFFQNLMSQRGYNWLVTKFQNERRPVQLATRRAELFDILERLGDKINDVDGQITRSTGMAVHLYETEMRNLVDDVHKAIEAYAKAKGVEIKEALPELHLILEARHEPERRLVKFLKTVPLDDDNKFSVKGLESQGRLSADGWREFIFKELTRSDISEKYVKDLRELLNKIVFAKDGKYFSKIIKKTDKNGKVTETVIDDEAAKSVFNRNSELYNVIANRTSADIARISKAFDTKALEKEIDAISKAVKAVQEKTIDLNKEANYWSKPVNNIKEFYGYDNYVPFKGRPDTEVDDSLELDSRRLGGELQDLPVGFEGRLSESENPLLQSLAEGAQAAMRAGRKDLTLSIKNAIKDNIIKGEKKPVKTIDFDERYLRGVDRQEIGGPDKIFHYLPNGTIEVWKINDKAQLEAIRRSYRTAQPLIDMANSLTSLVGQGHTRYNPAFAPMNFVRDSLTNAFLLGAKLGPKLSAQLISGISAEVASGGLNRSLNFARLYANGKFDEIKQLAGGDAAYDTLSGPQRYYRDLLDYVEMGGKVSYLQGVAAKGALDGLVKEVGRNGILKTKDQVDKFFDIYNDMFELAARVGAYRMLKDHFKNTAKTDKERDEAQVRAVEMSKNLANFEQVGQWGKAAGAAFMFFRPAATGAVVAIDTLRPMFGFNEADFRKEAAAEGRTEAQIETAIKKMREQSQNARRMAAALAGTGVLMYFAALMMSDDDEAGRNRVATDDMSRWTRYARFFIPGFDKPLQIPWAFGPGAFAAAGAQVASLASGRTRFGDMASNIMSIGLDSFLPLPFSRISPIDNFPAFALDSITPSAFRPFFEYVMNLDGLGREIYNNRQSRYGDAYTGGDSIPEIYKSAARSLFDATKGKVDWSPNTLYFFASNYIDGFAKMMSAGYNMGLTVTGQKDFDLKNDALFLNSFVGTKSNVDARDFSKAETYIKGLDKRINSLKDKPEMFLEYARENPEEFALVQMYNQQVNGGLRALREAANKVRVDRTLTVGERKAQLDQIVQLQNAVKRNILAGFEAVSGYRP